MEYVKLPYHILIIQDKKGKLLKIDVREIFDE